MEKQTISFPRRFDSALNLLTQVKGFARSGDGKGTPDRGSGSTLSALRHIHRQSHHSLRGRASYEKHGLTAVKLVEAAEQLLK
jgi:hypothetical protein